MVPVRQVSDFKKMIEEAKDMSVQKLIYLGKILEDDKTLDEAGVKEASFVVCMGGPKKPAPAPAAPPAAAPAPAPPAAVPVPVPATPATPADTVPPPLVPSPVAEVETPAQVAPAGPSDENVQQLLAMGFPEDEVRRALAAAFNDAERAVQYLMEGIPEMAPQVRARDRKGGCKSPPGARAVRPVFPISQGWRFLCLRLAAAAAAAAGGGAASRWRWWWRSA